MRSMPLPVGSNVGTMIALAALSLHGIGVCRAQAFHGWQVQPGASYSRFESRLDRVAKFSGGAKTRLWGFTRGEVVSLNGRVSASGGTDGVRIWNARTGKLLRILHKKDYAREVALSADGKTIAVAPPEDDLYIWDVFTGRGKWQYPMGVGHALSFSPDGRFCVGAEYGGTHNGKRDLYVIDMRTGKATATIRYGTDIDRTFISPDGRWVVSVDALDPESFKTAQISIWDIRTGALQRQWKWPQSNVTEFAISPDSSKIAAIDDRALRLWNLKSGKLIQSFSNDQRGMRALCFSLNGRVVASRSSAHVRLWRVR